MPFTYNGIGTHYYGKKNLQQRPGVCRQCGRAGNLQSYDTKLWFVVVFIPVIPLGRKHIIDSCPSCRRHYVADAHKWETSKQLETSGAMDKFRTNPTPENAVAAHQQLLGFHQIAEAAEFQKKMQEQFADNAKIHAYIGDALSHLGEVEQARSCYQRAFDLRPDLPEARVGLARAHIRDGKVDDANHLLAFLKTPGAVQLYSLEPLEILARAYQNAGKHAEALALFKCLIDGLPSVAQHYGFRKTVKASEKALKSKPSILPRAKLRQLFRAANGGQQVQLLRFGVAIALVAVVVGICFVISNEYIRRHRTVYIVNGLGAPIKGEIVGVGRFHVRGYSSMVIPEGHYRVHIDEPVKEDINLTVTAKYSGRWFDHPVWVINPRGAALIAFEVAVYSRGGERGSFAYRYGNEVEFFADIDFPFTPLPKSMQVSTSNPRLVRTHIEIANTKPANAFYALESDRKHGEAIRLAQWRLSSADDEEILGAWLVTANTNEIPQIAAYLSKHLTNRPVRIEMHRMYQTISGKTHAELRQQYDEMLSVEPQNADLSYLRGRMSDDNSEGRQFFDKALVLDPKHAYAMFAIAYDEACAGHWDIAKTMLDTCIQLQPQNKTFAAQWQVACLATSSFEPLEKRLRAEFSHNRTDASAAWNLCEALIASGRNAEAETVMSSLDQACRVRFERPVPEISNAVRYRVLYANGDIASLEKLCARDGSAEGTGAKIWTLVEQGHLEDAVKAFSKQDIKDPYFYLTLSLSAALDGNAEQASRWRAQALKLLASEDNKAAAQLLNNETALTTEAINKLILAPNAKAIVLANLAMLHPEKRAELAEVARKFNIQR
ncbi:MAG: cellulose synthase subunit BcsC, partial [Verrucomicrobiales bacterium]|nr:cellulose synthase subunit BcsC [Verrucomicrobiales bacterium]